MDFGIDDFPDDFLKFAWDNLPWESRLRMLSDLPKTVYLFGAGASHHYLFNAYGVNIPLAQGFFKALNNLPSSKGFHAHIGPLISYLQQYRGIHPSKAYEFEENIEDFMTSIENEIIDIRNKKIKLEKLSTDEFGKLVTLSQVYNNMIFLFANVINESQNGPVSPIFVELLKFCSPNDTFISFNWDTLLDKALASTGNWNPNIGYNFNFAAIFDGIWKDKIFCSKIKDGWKLFKLHGSTNWLVPYTGIHFPTADYQSIISEGNKVFLYWQSSFPYDTYSGRWRGGYESTCYGYYPPNIPTTYFSNESISVSPGKMISRFKLQIFSPFPEPDDPGIPSSPLIITPVKQKRYEHYSDTIEKLWKSAAEELTNADRIVLIGYSFPPTDIKTKNLIKDILEKRNNEIDLILIDPYADRILTKTECDFFNKAKSIRSYSIKFEDYIPLLWNSSSELMKKAIGESEDIKNWILRIYKLTSA